MTASPAPGMNLIELASACEAAEGPDRELDCLLAEAIGYQRIIPRGPCRDPDRRRWVDSRGMGTGWMDGSDHFPSHYTASLDAALTLVPEGYGKAVGDYWCEGEERPPFVGECYDLERIKSDPDYDPVMTWAHTEALALCAAALRARAAIQEQQG